MPEGNRRVHYRRKLILRMAIGNFEQGTSMLDRQQSETESQTAELTGQAERSSKRIHVALPIRVTYWDSEKKPCLEMSCTYDISERGARIGGVRSLKEAGEIIAVERGRGKAFCRVVWIRGVQFRATRPDRHPMR